MSLGCACAGAYALLTRAQFQLTQHIGKKLAFAELKQGEMLKNDTSPILTTGFAYASACFHHEIYLQHQRCEDEEELEVEREDDKYDK